MKSFLQILLSLASLALPVGLVLLIAHHFSGSDSKSVSERATALAQRFTTLGAAQGQSAELRELLESGGLAQPADARPFADEGVAARREAAREREQPGLGPSSERARAPRDQTAALQDALRVFGDLPGLSAPLAASGAAAPQGESAGSSLDEMLGLLQSLQAGQAVPPALSGILEGGGELDSSMQEVLQLFEALRSLDADAAGGAATASSAQALLEALKTAVPEK